MKGDLDGAIADATRAIKLNPKAELAHATRASVRLMKRDLDGAIADFNHAITLDPKNSDAFC
ncbi:MAG: hypothetical protein HGA93_04130, partial [Methanothrix sp.]|nr:hypothetical protein [Methanothrix sp.]